MELLLFRPWAWTCGLVEQWFGFGWGAPGVPSVSLFLPDLCLPLAHFHYRLIKLSLLQI